MSLAGKILTVFVTLTMLACIWLSAQVAQLNRNWGQAVVDQQRFVAEKTKDLAELKSGSYLATRHLLASRAATDHGLRVARQGLEDDQTRVSQDEETRVRAELLLEAEKSINASTKAARDRRLTERADLKEALAATYEELDRLSAESDRLIAHATELQDRFQSVLAENQELLEKAKSQPLPAFSRNRPAMSR